MGWVAGVATTRVPLDRETSFCVTSLEHWSGNGTPRIRETIQPLAGAEAGGVTGMGPSDSGSSVSTSRRQMGTRKLLLRNRVDSAGWDAGGY